MFDNWFLMLIRYICQNILFKLCWDIKLREGLFMYGGDKPSDEAAMKVANHELKGLMHYYSCNLKKLRFPLVNCFLLV